MIENVVVMGEFIGRDELISPVNIEFHVKYVSPSLGIKFEGNSDVVSLLQGKMAVAAIRANKIG